MFCRFCGATLADDSTFCHSCGKSLAATTTASTTSASAAPAPAPIPAPVSRPRGMGTRVPVLVGVGVIIFTLGVVWWLANSKGSPTFSSNPPSAPQPTVLSRTVTITDTAFTVAALNGIHFPFQVPPGATSVRLEGTFSATGGGSNDVEVYLFTNDEYVNWRNRHAVNTLYNSGRITQDTLNINLTSNPGAYVLVFSNHFSLLSPKAIRASIRLHYNL